jgi:hypothetical protein
LLNNLRLTETKIIFLLIPKKNGANKNINLRGGFRSAGDNTNIHIGLQNLLSSENNSAGSKIVTIGQSIVSNGSENKYKIGVSADFEYNARGSKIVKVEGVLSSVGNGNEFTFGL